jgi:hypothetical protein
MELVAGDVEAFHCGFADLDALLVVRVSSALSTFRPALVVGRPDQLSKIQNRQSAEFDASRHPDRTQTGHHGQTMKVTY